MKRRIAETVSLATIALLGTAVVLAVLVTKRNRLPYYWQVPPFQLTADDGHQISTEDLKGKVWVAEFFFASCAGICLQMNKNMMKVQAAFRDHPDFWIVSFTVDPQTDTPKMLRLYKRNYNAIEGKWWFVTGDKKKIYRLARHGFKISVAEVPPSEEGGPRDFIHSDRFILVDRDGWVRGFYNGTDQKEVKRLIEDIRSIL